MKTQTPAVICIGCGETFQPFPVFEDVDLWDDLCRVCANRYEHRLKIDLDEHHPHDEDEDGIRND